MAGVDRPTTVTRYTGTSTCGGATRCWVGFGGAFVCAYAAPVTSRPLSVTSTTVVRCIQPPLAYGTPSFDASRRPSRPRTPEQFAQREGMTRDMTAHAVNCEMWSLRKITQRRI